MKQIGYTDCATKDHVWRLTDDGMTSPHVLSVSDMARRDEFYIERDYLNVGWILPADAADNGGRIYSDRQGVNSVACYVKREQGATSQRIPDLDDARERITALEKAFVMLTAQSADVIEAQRASIERLTAQIKEVHAYAGSLEMLMRGVTGKGANDERRWQAALAALPGLVANYCDAQNAAISAYEYADAMIAADVPISDQAHTD